MGETLLAGCCAPGGTPSSIVGADRRESRRQELEGRYGVRCVESPADAVDGADIVLLVVKPRTSPTCSPPSPRTWPTGALVVSLCAGVTTAQLEGATARGHPRRPGHAEHARPGLRGHGRDLRGRPRRRGRPGEGRPHHGGGRARRWSIPEIAPRCRDRDLRLRPRLPVLRRGGADRRRRHARPAERRSPPRSSTQTMSGLGHSCWTRPGSTATLLREMRDVPRRDDGRSAAPPRRPCRQGRRSSRRRKPAGIARQSSGVDARSVRRWTRLGGVGFKRVRFRSWLAVSTAGHVLVISSRVAGA
jgi:hypothetical protein